MLVITIARSVLALVLVAAALAAPARASTCDGDEVAYTVEMEDSYGDGWNGAVFTFIQTSDGAATTATTSIVSSCRQRIVCNAGFSPPYSSCCYQHSVSTCGMNARH